jgi:hypothetical protein
MRPGIASGLPLCQLDGLLWREVGPGEDGRPVQVDGAVALRRRRPGEEESGDEKGEHRGGRRFSVVHEPLLGYVQSRTDLTGCMGKGGYTEEVKGLR